MKIKCDLETLNTNTDVMPVSSNQRRSSICRKALGDLIIFEQTQRNETPKIKSNDKTKRTFTLQAADTVVAIKSDIEKLLENREISRRLKSKTD